LADDEHPFRHSPPPLCAKSNVRFGSKADIAVRPGNVCFTPESRHRLSALGGPLCAKSGHMQCSKFAESRRRHVLAFNRFRLRQRKCKMC
jgi:hypothetical protein